MPTLERNELHYGDNLTVMREKIPDEIADLIYLDPPFNSARNCNLLFKQVKGDASPAESTCIRSGLRHRQRTATGT